MQMVKGNGGNQFGQYAWQIAGNLNGYNAVQNVGNLIVQKANGNGNVIAARAEGNRNRNNGNQIKCYNCRGMGHYARNYIVRARRRDAAYLQTQLLIAQKEEARIQLQDEEFDLMASSDKAPVYDSDGSAEVHHFENYYDKEIFNMFTQEEHYTELLEPITEPHTVQQYNSNVIFIESSVEHNGGTVEQHFATVEETRAHFESLYNNLVTKVEKVNMVNRKMKETNADLTTKLARYWGQEKSFEINIGKI
ncbi:retrovirus-related pol polyprotein from transposon TNT 1-94 [Tanacetum coccineum]